MEANWSSRMLFFLKYFVVPADDATAGIMQARVISNSFVNAPSSTYTSGDNHCLKYDFSIFATPLLHSFLRDNFSWWL